MAHNGGGWVVYNSLAKVYAAKGQKAAALDYARQALAAAPPDKRAEVPALIDSLGN